MRPLGYMYKQVAKRPEWLKAPQVDDIYSLSGCVSPNFADYISFWKHNGYWLFDSPEILKIVAAEHQISLEGLKLFYYEAYEWEYDEEKKSWISYEPERSFVTNIEPLSNGTLQGFDVVSFSVHTSPECSPLSCNSRAMDISTNSHCLIPTFAEAKLAIEELRFADSEPGPYRIVGVYSVDNA